MVYYDLGRMATVYNTDGNSKFHAGNIVIWTYPIHGNSSTEYQKQRFQLAGDIVRFRNNKWTCAVVKWYPENWKWSLRRSLPWWKYEIAKRFEPIQRSARSERKLKYIVENRVGWFGNLCFGLSIGFIFFSQYHSFQFGFSFFNSVFLLSKEAIPFLCNDSISSQCQISFEIDKFPT